jgi:hypothetical protein
MVAPTHVAPSGIEGSEPLKLKSLGQTAAAPIAVANMISPTSAARMLVVRSEARGG